MTIYIAKNFLRAALAVMSSLSILGAVATHAANATVQVGATTGNPDVFVPSTSSINVGDTVTWNWVGTFHSSTGTNNATPPVAWDTGVITTLPHSYSFTFTNAGTYPYRCTVHVSFGMVGTVTVASSTANQPPTVTLTNPPASSILSAPANIKLGATATDSDGTVVSVQFFVDAASVATVATAPYTATANGLAAGSHTITAIATDNLGATATNTISLSVVTPVPVSVTQPQMVSGTNFQFSYSANPGLFYLVARSTSLASSTWQSLSTNKAQSASVTFVDTNVPPSAGFYRVGLMPNP